MRSFIVIAFLLALTAAASAQSSPTASTQASDLLQQSLAAQTGGVPLADITLSGNVTFIHGTQTESGPMTLTALAVGTTRVEFDLPSGTRAEVWSKTKSVPVTSGTGPNASGTEPAGGSLAMPSPSWFSPALLTPLLSGTGYANSYIGSEMRNGAAVQHLSVWQTAGQGRPMPALAARQQTQSDIYLDPATFLPVSMVFQIRPHPQPGKPLSIRARPAPEEVRFSDYREFQGRRMPFHIQLFLGPPPHQQEIMDLTISSAALNTGATIVIPAAAAN
ncbi:MAG: hypothetical protein ACRD40_00610 [Candidatus Acidiferrales bacterium]